MIRPEAFGGQDAYLALVVLLEILDSLFGLGLHVKNPLCNSVQVKSCIGKDNFFTDDVQELEVVVALQLLDLLGYSRLGDAKKLSCLGKALVLGCKIEGFKMI